MNHQPINLPPEQQSRLLAGELLPVMERFYSLQGEGFHTGKPASFLRIGGCDVGCYWCDVKEAWDASVHPLTPIEDIIQFVLAQPAKALVITGGEPLSYNLDKLCAALKEKQVTIFLETCGAYPLSGQYDWICLSPKTNMEPRRDMLHAADELKVIIRDPSDFSWAEKNASLVKDKCKLFLQPEWSQHHKILPRIVSYVKENPKWMVSLQAHKYMQIP